MAYSSFVMPLAQRMGLPEWAVGTSIAAGLVVEVFAFRSAGVVLERLGTRRTLLGAATLTVIRWTLVAFTTHPALAIALHALHGITFGLMYATLVSLLARRIPDEMRQTAQGVLGASAFGIGGALGALLTGGMLDRVGPRAAWLSMAAVALVGLAVALVATRRDRVPATLRP
jgi:PPP family 3-phenylpropionic acid transporter